MKNFLDTRNTIILILVVVVVVLITSYLKNNTNNSDNSLSGIESNLVKLNKDMEFYKYLSIYKSLLDDEESKLVDERSSKINEELADEDSKIVEALTLFIVNEIMKDENSKKIILDLKDKVDDLVKKSEIDESVLFTKNTECAKFSSDIKEELSKKYKSTSTVTETEELNFIFYSPELNTCLYSTSYNYDYSNYSNRENPYYSKDSYRVYEVSSSNPIQKYPSYYYKYPYLSEDEADKSAENGLIGYKKFILENSGYNAKLLKDINY